MTRDFQEIKDDVRYMILQELADASFDGCDCIGDIRYMILESAVESAQHLTDCEIIEYVQTVILDPSERKKVGLRFSDFDEDAPPFQLFAAVTTKAFEQVWDSALTDFLKGVRND